MSLPQVLEGGKTPPRRKDTEGQRASDGHQCCLVGEAE